MGAEHGLRGLRISSRKTAKPERPQGLWTALCVALVWTVAPSLAWAQGTLPQVLIRELDAKIRRGTATCLPGTAPQGLALDNGVVSRAHIVDQIDGYARQAHTTGGLEGGLRTVTTTADNAPGQPVVPGSLRGFLEEAARKRMAMWIVFDPALGSQPHIELLQTLRLPSNLTIDGTCSNVVLEAPSDSRIILAYIESGTTNVIVSGLTFRKTGYLPGSEDNESAIRVNGAFDRVAILHNDLSACGDGCIDITVSPGKALPPPARITVSYNFVHDHDKVMLFGTFTCPQIRGLNQCDEAYFQANQHQPPVLFLTLHDNVFWRTGQRHPRVFGRVMAHIANNVIGFEAKRQADGQRGSTYGVFVSNAARALVERNVFGPLERSLTGRAFAVWTVKTPGAPRIPTDTEGFVKLRANLTWGGAIAAEDRPALVPAPPYHLGLLRLVVRSPEQAIRCIVHNVGPESAEPIPSPSDCFESNAPRPH